jgi:2-polyprenyl-6-methoxyphenol hydroxylase-like FAD-dependent oxidoreductase
MSDPTVALLAQSSPVDVDVLIVGAGPTGLALATQLQSFGTKFRIVDRAFDRAHESRALAVQARTLELLDISGLADALVARGRTSTRFVLHLGARTAASLTLGDIAATDTRFPFILFVSQTETERILGDHLTQSGITIERGVDLVRFAAHDAGVDCLLRHHDGREELVRSAYLAGCDGAHSTVRKEAGFSFAGGSYPQDFVLGDVEADGPLERGAINSFAGGRGVAVFFPLGEPSTWRVIAMRAAAMRAQRQEPRTADDSPVGALTLGELQAIVAPPTEGSVTVRDPAWLTHFRLHHRQIAHYRAGRVFLAGDAAHIHSPVGAQGMNTGIQDAWNLGWKLSVVARGVASGDLLDSYEAERWPVGQFLLRYTDRIFSTFTRAMSAGRVMTWTRGFILRYVAPVVLASKRLRATAFRFVSELGIRYRESPAVEEGQPRLRVGPRAGDRLPDACLTRDGRPITLHRALLGPHVTLLLCGEGAWDATRLRALREHREGVLRVAHLRRRPAPSVLVDETGATLAMLCGRERGQYLLRPDGYVAFRCAGENLEDVSRYLARWYPAVRARHRRSS